MYGPGFGGAATGYPKAKVDYSILAKQILAALLVVILFILSLYIGLFNLIFQGLIWLMREIKGYFLFLQRWLDPRDFAIGSLVLNAVLIGFILWLLKKES